MTTPQNLPGIIKELEELILSSTGVDPFKETLKLIYVKIYKEKHQAKNLDANQIFEKAKKEWPDIFDHSDKIEIPAEHLKLCLNILNKTKIYQTDLTIIDTAFEHLLPKTAKASRGQFFTPRHIITEIIKILNPQKDELFLDPAAGSGGFLLHTALHTKNDKNIYGTDFDNAMFKISKTIMLLSGFQNAKIYKANFLTSIKDLKPDSFDIIATNPPFGGEIKDKEILQNYELAKNKKGETRKILERHILFIEKIIKLLRPSGRAAIIVPQSILNNTNLNYIREWIYSKARIIAVIGLDTNAFKPHTNVKTSILFLQKWQGAPPSDYPVFMAVSQKSGKNLSGSLIYKNNKIDTDLIQIASDLKKFIKKEQLNF